GEEEPERAVGAGADGEGAEEERRPGLDPVEEDDEEAGAEAERGRRPAQRGERRRHVVALQDEDGEEELEAEADPDRPPVDRAAVRGEGDGEAEDEREPEQPAQEGVDVHRGVVGESGRPPRGGEARRYPRLLPAST